ncbi:hypothetical protein RN001_006244 [Aquatica leii]|uniref:Ubiquitin-like domain-containing protein n=1 Tax=Aquatica leii TaxID=1421715 RepID=A0AAN7P7N5_9COLE|nr:hypothetical protein RN001_006244 [Aquatica leii]
MLMIDDFGDKILQLFVSIVIVIVVCLAWWSTNIREQPHYRTVFLLERRLRRRIHQTRLTTHIQSSSIVEGEQAEEVTTTSDNQASDNTVQSTEENKPPIATTSANGSSSNSEGTSSSAEDEELADIVRIMDANTNVVRRRRLAYYENLSNSSQERSNNDTELGATSSDVDNPEESTNTEVDNHIETLNDSIMEHNYAERDALDIDSIKNNNDKEKCSNSQTEESTDTNIRIKLKYLNDELKLVDGKLEEQLGDFKRRHFHPEFASNKLVRLIFNGQVLQPDTETLQSCGLFDNCVVHCLIHQQRNVYNEGNSNDGTFSSRNGNNGLPQTNSNQGRDWDLGNTLLVLVSLILGSAWFFRYEYAHLYTVTATVALVAITGIFTVFLVGIYFPDADHTPPPPQPAQVEQEATS